MMNFYEFQNSRKENVKLRDSVALHLSANKGGGDTYLIPCRTSSRSDDCSNMTGHGHTILSRPVGDDVETVYTTLLQDRSTVP